MLTTTSQTLRAYEKLTTEQKEHALRNWYASVQTRHEQYVHDVVAKKAHYDEDNSAADLSKVDLLRLADGKPMIFHHTEKYLRLFFNAPGKGFEVQTLDHFPKRLDNFSEWDYRGASGYLDNMNHYSFEPELAQYTRIATEWLTLRHATLASSQR